MLCDEPGGGSALIGECYLYGAMDGEFEDKLKETPEKERDVRLVAYSHEPQ